MEYPWRQSETGQKPQVTGTRRQVRRQSGGMPASLTADWAPASRASLLLLEQLQHVRLGSASASDVGLDEDQLLSLGQEEAVAQRAVGPAPGRPVPLCRTARSVQGQQAYCCAGQKRDCS